MLIETDNDPARTLDAVSDRNMERLDALKVSDSGRTGDAAQL